MTEPAYDPADPQSGRALVNYHLVQLGIGESWVPGISEHGQRTARHVLPQDVGVCRAYILTEAAWPEGAELCVTVTWSPDATMRRSYQKRTLPDGAPEHWRERIAATARALESLGYVVEPSRWPSPHYTLTRSSSFTGCPTGCHRGRRPLTRRGRSRSRCRLTTRRCFGGTPIGIRRTS